MTSPGRQLEQSSPSKYITGGGTIIEYEGGPVKTQRLLSEVKSYRSKMKSTMGTHTRNNDGEGMGIRNYNVSVMDMVKAQS